MTINALETASLGDDKPTQIDDAINSLEGVTINLQRLLNKIQAIEGIPSPQIEPPRPKQALGEILNTGAARINDEKDRMNQIIVDIEEVLF